MEHVDDQIYRNLSELVNLDDVGMLYLEFVVTEDKLGVTETVDLIPGGKCLSFFFGNSYVHVILYEARPYSFLKVSFVTQLLFPFSYIRW